MRGRARVVALAATFALSSCKRSDDAKPSKPTADAAVVAEAAPRCRLESGRWPFPGDDIVLGDAAVFPDRVVVGVVRRDPSAGRVTSLVSASLDLARVRVTDLGPPSGDAPPPSPRARGAALWVVSYAPRSADAGAPAHGARELRIAEMDGEAANTRWSVRQQADESFAYDVAFPDGDGPPLVAWDEDAPLLPGAMLASRGVVKVEVAGVGPAQAVSPQDTDAESPKLARRKGGFWLAWIARRPESSDAGAHEVIESAGERRAFRWIELVALDARGAPASPVRRLTSPQGHVAWFDLAGGAGGAAGDGERATAVVQDESAARPGGGGRLFVVTADDARAAASTSPLVDGGVSAEIAEAAVVVAGDAKGAAARWVAWTDLHERASVTTLDPMLLPTGAGVSLEAALDGTRLLGGVAEHLVAAALPVEGASRAAAKTGRAELRALSCPLPRP